MATSETSRGGCTWLSKSVFGHNCNCLERKSSILKFHVEQRLSNLCFDCREDLGRKGLSVIAYKGEVCIMRFAFHVPKVNIAAWL